MPARPVGICWDLDHTLGNFTPLIVGSGDGETGLRHGIADALERLSHRGARHFITTTGSLAYVRRVLERTGLGRQITRVFTGEEIDAGAGKRYRPVARALGLSDLAATRQLIAIGDVIYDQPADMSGLVFIHQPDGYRTEGALIEQLLTSLLDAGGGDFHAGFLALHDSDLPSMLLPAGITVRLQWRDPHAGGRLPRLGVDLMIPTVTVLSSGFAYEKHGGQCRCAQCWVRSGA